MRMTCFSSDKKFGPIRIFPAESSTPLEILIKYFAHHHTKLTTFPGPEITKPFKITWKVIQQPDRDKPWLLRGYNFFDLDNTEKLTKTPNFDLCTRRLLGPLARQNCNVYPQTTILLLSFAYKSLAVKRVCKKSVSALKRREEKWFTVYFSPAHFTTELS